MTALSKQSQAVLARLHIAYDGLEAEDCADIDEIVRELLLLVQAQAEALDLGRDYFTSIDTPSRLVTLRECELMRKEFVDSAAEALAHTDEVMKRLGGAG